MSSKEQLARLNIKTRLGGLAVAQAKVAQLNGIMFDASQRSPTFRNERLTLMDIISLLRMVDEVYPTAE